MKSAIKYPQNTNYISMKMIEVNNLNFTYPRTKEPTLKNLTFSIKKGEIFGFLGPNGAGKTTTQKILIGLLKKFTGEVSVLGKSLTNWKEDYYNNIGVCFELPNSYGKLTGLENLKFFASFYTINTLEPMELLEKVNLHTVAKKPVAQYSKGMKMRLNFARALLNDPKILFLDEPTTGQDPEFQRVIKNLILEEKKKGKTIFLTTHNMTDADELCDRIALIHKGELAVVDNPTELKIKHGKNIVEVSIRKNQQLEYIKFPLKNIGINSEFSEFMQSNNTIIETIHSREASLEEIFLKITGARLVK